MMLLMSFHPFLSYIILERAYIFFKLDTETETKLKELFRSFYFKKRE